MDRLELACTEIAHLSAYGVIFHLDFSLVRAADTCEAALW